MLATKNEPEANRGPHFVRACAVEMHMDISEETLHAIIYNTPDQDLDNPGHRLCANLRVQNAHGHLRRALSCENLQQKCRGSESVPGSNPGLLTLTVRTTQCGHTVCGKIGITQDWKTVILM